MFNFFLPQFMLLHWSGKVKKTEDRLPYCHLSVGGLNITENETLPQIFACNVFLYWIQFFLQSILYHTRKYCNTQVYQYFLHHYSWPCLWSFSCKYPTNNMVCCAVNCTNGTSKKSVCPVSAPFWIGGRQSLRWRRPDPRLWASLPLQNG